MAANVYANGMEVSGKASPHKVIASMPDVCLSPPSPPAGPVPIPYPNFAQASDTTDGSKTVKIGGKEVNLKGKSKYKKSKGDEAATRNFGAGLLSHSITGAVKHKAGSFNVEIEGCGVVRNLDLTTGNHSNPGDGCTNVDTAGVAPGMGDDPDCKTLEAGNKARRNELKQAEEKTTISHAKIERPGEKTTTVWSCSRSLVSAYQNGNVKPGYVSGLERVDRDVIDSRKRQGGEASNLCDDARKQLMANNDGKAYASTKFRPHTSHTESRILESLFASGSKLAGTKVTFAINWNTRDDDGDFFKKDDPCDACHKLICAAQACEITILFCAKKNEPKDIEKKTGKECT
jgi:hypothetical protein